jgi:flavin-dependent dehydrogenase
MIEECVIIGGGVAGLSAANHLVDEGVFPLIIDGGKYPSHKICGEFFSHECLRILNRWKIPMTGEIKSASFNSPKKTIEFDLPKASASCSRFSFDTSLFERAMLKGARALTEVSVTTLIKHSNSYQIALSNGQTIEARQLMIGTGKIPKITQDQKNLEMAYFGFKAHFENIDIGKCVEMHLFPGGYLGISNVDEKVTNIACLVKKEKVSQFENPEDFINDLLKDKSMGAFQNRMKSAKMISPKWLVGQLPEFGIRKNPKLDNIYWIGDAAGSIPPISGDGLAIAITSGCMAAENYMFKNAANFQTEWLKRYRRRFLVANSIHKIMTHDWTKGIAMSTCQTFPKLPLFLWSQTREL